MRLSFGSLAPGGELEFEDRTRPNWSYPPPEAPPIRRFTSLPSIPGKENNANTEESRIPGGVGVVREN